MAELTPRVLDEKKSPSYPQRVHIHERAEWEVKLKSWEERIEAVKPRLANMPPGPEREAAEKLHAQMLGARDQLFDSVRRLPMEVGSMYEEDRLRAEEAIAALERLFQRWPAG